MSKNNAFTGVARSLSSLIIAFLLIIGFFFFFAKSAEKAWASPADLFVKPGGSGSVCTQAQPCSLDTALSIASPDAILYLAGGNYTSSEPAVLDLTQNQLIYGGWDGAATTPVHRDPAAYPTVLDGQNLRRGVMIAGPAAVTLDGLSVKKGFAEIGGAGLYSQNADLVLRHVIFDSNAVTKTTYTYGGGAWVWGGSLLVDGCTFLNNTAASVKASYGGGIVISETTSAQVQNSTFNQNYTWWGSAITFFGEPGAYSDLTLQNNDFQNQSAGYVGEVYVKDANAHVERNLISGAHSSNDYGAIAFFNSKVDLSRNTITNNWGGRISAVTLSSVDPFTLTNNIIGGNTSAYDWLKNPAVSVRDSSGKFLNNTIADNHGAYGVLVDGSSLASFTNTILVSNTVAISVSTASTASLNATLWGGGEWANGMNYGGDGSIDIGTLNYFADPGFVNPVSRDYHIGQGSGAIDQGVDDGVLVDIDGDPRPQGAGYDIGADEYSGWKVFLPFTAK